MDSTSVRNGSVSVSNESEFDLIWEISGDPTDLQIRPTPPIDEAGVASASDDASKDASPSGDDADNEYYPIPMHEKDGAVKAYLVRGAWLACTYGSHHRYLNLPRSHGSYINDDKDYPIMNAMDCTPGQVDTSNLSEGNLGGSLLNVAKSTRLGSRLHNRITGNTNVPQTQMLQVLNIDTLNIPPFGVCQSPIGPRGLGNIILKSEKFDPVMGGAKKDPDENLLAIEDNVKGPPCVVGIVGCWKNTSPDTLVSLSGETPYEALMTDSFLQCRHGGFVIPRTCGQPDAEPPEVDWETVFLNDFLETEGGILDEFPPGFRDELIHRFQNRTTDSEIRKIISDVIRVAAEPYYNPAQYDDNGLRRFLNKLDAAGGSVLALVPPIDGVNLNTTTVGAFLLMMDYDEYTGTIHARQKNWQRFFGFNYLYEDIFGRVTSKNNAEFPFTHNGEDLVFWAWKGDYLNLGAGAELAMYRRLTVPGVSVDHWIVDTDLAMPMSMTLESIRGTPIASYNPSEPHWWITSFNPAFQRVNNSDLKASFTLYFENDKELFKSFFLEYGENVRWTFDEQKYTATLIF